MSVCFARGRNVCIQSPYCTTMPSVAPTVARHLCDAPQYNTLYVSCDLRGFLRDVCTLERHIRSYPFSATLNWSPESCQLMFCLLRLQSYSISVPSKNFISLITGDFCGCLQVASQ